MGRSDNNMESNKRLKYIDIARGIAMFTIVLGHAITSSSGHAYSIYRILYFINVPIFFVLSGYVFRIKEGESFFKFLKDKFFRIMLPYFFWALIFLIPYFALGNDVADQLSRKSSFDIWTQIGNVFYGNGADNALKQNSPLWFLPALFTTEVLFYYVVYCAKKRRTEIIVFIATLLVGFLCTFFTNNFYLPWGLNSALTIGCFFYFGYLIKEWAVFDRLKTKRNSISLFVICIILCGFVIYFNGPESVGWQGYRYQNYFLTILAGLTSALAIILISKWINKNRVIECIGKNTMSILIFHKIIIVIAQTKLGVFSKLLMNSNMALELCFALTISAMAIIISIVIGLIIKKALPELIGERRRRIE